MTRSVLEQRTAAEVAMDQNMIPCRLRIRTRRVYVSVIPINDNLLIHLQSKHVEEECADMSDKIKMLDGRVEDWPVASAQALYNLAARCLEMKPDHRPEMQTVSFLTSGIDID